MNTTEITPRQKFQNYFNLKDGFYIDDDQIDGECTHEGQYVKYQLYIHTGFVKYVNLITWK